MNVQKIDATLETRKSKAGNDYQVVVVKITDKIEKLVFLSDAELELLKLSNSKSSLTFGK